MIRCPAYKSGYPVETTQKLGAELTDLLKRDPSAVTPGIVADYKRLLCGCRALESETVPSQCQ